MSPKEQPVAFAYRALLRQMMEVEGRIEQNFAELSNHEKFHNYLIEEYANLMKLEQILMHSNSSEIDLEVIARDIVGTKSNKHLYLIWMEQAHESSESKLGILKIVSNAILEDAVGLFTFGHIEVTAEIVTRIPPVPSSNRGGHLPMGRQLAMCLTQMLPLPHKLNPIKDPAGAYEWITTNIEKIRWDPVLMVYQPKPT